MNEVKSSPSRIAKNTIILYGRMLLMMFIGIYTSRLVLQALGVTDYGIYNIVGGLITAFTIVSDAFTQTIGRFIRFHLGKGNIEKLRLIFSTSVVIQILLSLIIIILMETVGLWFLNSKLVIPPERLYAAHWVYHLSVISFALNLISVPYMSVITSHEKMGVFAYFTIFDAICKLSVAIIIYYASWDKLIILSILSTVIAVIVRIMYGVYCKKHFEECKHNFTFDKKVSLEMLKFSGWNFISSSAVVLRVQGSNIMLNMFFGPIINAAKGIANQLNAMMNGFVANFLTAVTPQITKNYAAGDLEYVRKLVYKGAKFSYFIFLLVSIPILCDTHFVLQLWLGQVPDHSVLFVRLIVLYTLLDTVSRTVTTSIYATGNIAQYQIYVTAFEILNLPISFFLLSNGAIPEIVTIVSIVLTQLCLLSKLIIAHRQIMLSVRKYMCSVYFKALFVTVISSSLPLLTLFILEESFFRFITICILSVLSTTFTVYYVGCDAVEKQFINNKITILKNKYVRLYK